MSKIKPAEPKKEDAVELETQFILRMPEEPANVLHELIQSGSNSLKDRLSITLEQDLRYGEVRLDHWLLHAKVVDLPTIMESLKTIDNKSFYKTSDICQLMLCKEEPDPPEEEESPNKAKKKDPNKVDKKYLWPHGITPPCKNVRKRRFRKTLKKKFVEAPEIEKEVKRLLRIDNDAVSVKYEIINEDEDTKSETLDNLKEQALTDEDKQDVSFRDMLNKGLQGESDGEVENDRQSNIPPARGLGEHDIFGGEVSSSDEEDNRNDRQQDNSRFDEDSRLSEYSLCGNGGTGGRADASCNENKDIITEFDKSMFSSPKAGSKEFLDDLAGASGGGFFDQQHSNDYDFSEPQLTKEQINMKILEMRKQCDDLKVQQNQKSLEISNIQNPTLKQRLQETVDNLLSQIVEKEMEIQDYQNMLQSKAN